MGWGNFLTSRNLKYFPGEGSWGDFDQIDLYFRSCKKPCYEKQALTIGGHLFNHFTSRVGNYLKGVAYLRGACSRHHGINLYI